MLFNVFTFYITETNVYLFISELPITRSEPSLTVTLRSEPLLTPRAHCSTFTSTNTPLNLDKKDEKLFSLLYIIKEQNSHILSLLETKKQETIVQLPDNLFPPLPISSDVDLQIFEEKLKENKENLTILVIIKLNLKNILK